MESGIIKGNAVILQAQNYSGRIDGERRSDRGSSAYSYGARNSGRRGSQNRSARSIESKDQSKTVIGADFIDLLVVCTEQYSAGEGPISWQCSRQGADQIQVPVK